MEKYLIELIDILLKKQSAEGKVELFELKRKIENDKFNSKRPKPETGTEKRLL